MATRRYHKKRVGRKSRRVGRKSRRVRGGKLMKGGGLKVDLTTIPDGIEGFKFLNNLIRTKTGVQVYKITTEIKYDENDPNHLLNAIMTWNPIAGGMTKVGSYVKATLFKPANLLGFHNQTPKEEFIKNITEIYKEDLKLESNPEIKLSQLDNINTQDKVTLDPTGITIGTTKYTIAGLPPINFVINVVKFYKNLKD
jgi:hypothetical protein